MDQGPYRDANERRTASDDERIEEGHVESFAHGDVCRACGAIGARPARPALAEDFDERSKNAEEYPHRIALCAQCAELQRKANSRERALSLLALTCVGPAMLAALAPATPSFALVIGATLLSALASWLAYRALVARAPLAAVVLSVERDQMRVWLSGTNARAAPRHMRTQRLGHWFLWSTATTGMAASLLWTAANPRIEFETFGVSNVNVVVNRTLTADITEVARSWTRLPYGINRLEFVSSYAIPPLEIRQFLRGSVTVRVAIPECGERDDEGSPKPFQLEWRRHDFDVYKLDCVYTR